MRKINKSPYESHGKTNICALCKEITLHEHTALDNSLDYVMYVRLIAMKKDRYEMIRV
jgi:hypothetical protein